MPEGVALARDLVGPAMESAIAFDEALDSCFRNAIYPAYKANRAAMPDDLAAQIPALHECVRAQGWPLLIRAAVGDHLCRSVAGDHPRDRGDGQRQPAVLRCLRRAS